MSYKCSLCQQTISEKVHKYSVENFGKPLCFEHQKNSVSTKKYYCSDCKQEITRGEFKYSMYNFDKALCRECQPEKEEKFSAAPKKFRGTYRVNT